MNIWLDDYDSIKIVTKDGETVAEVSSDGKASFEIAEKKEPKD